MTYNLIEERWIPVRTLGGSRKPIAPWEMTDPEDPIVGLDAPRPDFNGALIQFLIGLVQTTIAPKNHGEWLQHWHDPPTPKNLHAQFKSVAHAFNLDGDGPRFMQDLELDKTEEKSVAALFIEAPGDKTVEDNTDHFIKSGGIRGLCGPCAGTALFTLQANAPSGGVGHRTSLRGGGPLTTLVIGEFDRLWRLVWLNTLTVDIFLKITGANPEETKRVGQFPWLGRTRTSEPQTGCATTPEDVHPAQVFWAMPRRIRLNFSNTSFGRCDVCGEHSDTLIQTYTSKNYGINYEGPWRHPLTPHSRDKTGHPIPRHGQPGGVTYRHWLGLAQEDLENHAEPAYVVHEFRTRRQLEGETFRLWAFGYDMDNMKARCWYEGVMPLPELPQEIREVYEHEVARFVRAADQVGGYLRSSIKKAWFERPGDAKGDFGFVQKTFWQNTEADFYAFLMRIRDTLESGDEIIELRINWRQRISREALRIFDELAAAGPIQDADPKRIALARKDLEMWNFGKKIAGILDLPLQK